MEILAEHLPAIGLLLAAGLAAGIAAGLFGIGGGAIIVPVLYFLLTGLGFGDTAMHVAVSTSLATIILTSLRSLQAHHRRGAVDFGVLRSWTPWIILGAVAGMLVAGALSGPGLTLVFGVLALTIAAQLIFGRPQWQLAPDLPAGVPRAATGSVIGALSSMMGLGGGAFGVTVMTLCNRPIHQAVATAAGFGVAIGLPGAITAVITGWGRDGLPWGSIGYVNLPAFAVVSVCTVLMAPLGARLAHALNALVLRRLFGVVLGIVAVRLVLSGVQGLVPSSVS